MCQKYRKKYKLYVQSCFLLEHRFLEHIYDLPVLLKPFLYVVIFQPVQSLL